MKWPVLLFFFLIFLSTCFYVPPASGAGSIARTIVVSLFGNGEFTSIQQAVNSVPDNNNEWIRIHVVAGVYREKVFIPSPKRYIFLEGEGAMSTSIEWNDYCNDSTGHNTESSATFLSYAPNLVVKGIAFKNTYNGFANMKQAVSAWILGDKSSFYYCSFSSYQDTLGDAVGRHYFKGCYIEGVVDFIFGYARSIYEECTISTVNTVQKPGFITAHGRGKPADNGAFVFKRCNVTGPQATYLGRAWKDYSRVIFYQTFMAGIIIPQGWYIWFSGGHETDITYVEAECTGPGSNKTGRVWWEKTLSDAELRTFVDISFIDDEGWLAAQPISYLN